MIAAWIRQAAERREREVPSAIELTGGVCDCRDCTSHARRGYGENTDGTLDVRPARYDQVDRWPL